MDTSLTSSLYLVPHWKARLLEDYEDEVGGADAWPVKLLEREGRKAVWGMCALLGVDANGVPGMACQLLERYLAANFREHASSLSKSAFTMMWLVKLLQREGRKGVWSVCGACALDANGVLGMACQLLDRYLAAHFREHSSSLVEEEWDDYKHALALRVPLLMASCIQLAAKMNCTGFLVNPNLVRSCLMCKGLEYSLAEVKSSEFHVFRTLGYRVPVWTSVEAAQLLAVEVRLPGSMTAAVAMVVNLVEYRRDYLNARVRAIANVSPTFNNKFDKGTVRTLHLVAGAVLATSRYLGFKGPDPAACLASCTRAPLFYVRCICDVILTDIIVDDDEYENHSFAKRRRN